MSLKLLHENDNKKNLIIFVHGLGGDINTFKNKKNEMFHQFFDKLILDNCDIGYFEYPTSFLYFKSLNVLSNVPFVGSKIQYKFNTNVDTLSQLLKTEYDNNKSKYEKIHFIGHSLGGIVIKFFLLNYYQDSNDKKLFYITLSTPHNGSIYAEFNFFNNPHMKELKYDSKLLIQLNEAFKYKKDQFKRKYYVAINDTIVKEENAFQEDDELNKVNVHGNHIMISKPTNDNESSTLLKHINQTIIDFLELRELNKIENIETNEFKLKDILFEGYRKESYPYYLKRAIDEKIARILESKNIWLYGNSGVGKTNIAQYYMHNKGQFFHSTYFTSTKEKNIQVYLNTLYEELSDRINSTTKVNDQHDINQKLKVILCDLSKKFKHIIIHLDELSDIGDNDTKNLLISFIDILTNNISSCGLHHVSLIISTRYNPTCYLNNFEDISYENKINSLFSFIEIHSWTSDELLQLYDILSKALNIVIDNIDEKIGNTITTQRELKNILGEKYND